jgi:hypothetical protein
VVINYSAATPSEGEQATSSHDLVGVGDPVRQGQVEVDGVRDGLRGHGDLGSVDASLPARPIDDVLYQHG